MTSDYTSVEEMKENEMYSIIGNNNKRNCAKVLATNYLLEKARKTKMNVVFLPSSIHEVLAIPLKNIDKKEIFTFKKMVKEVNEDENVIDKTDILSDSIYIYDYQEDILLNA